MKNRILFSVIIIFLLIYSIPLFAGDIYTYKNKKGKIVISNEPLPDEAYNARMVESYKRSTPQEIEQFQQRQKAAVNTGFQSWQNSQNQNQTQNSSISVTQDKQENKIIRRKCPLSK